jgi:hypothetical protein
MAAWRIQPRDGNRFGKSFSLHRRESRRKRYSLNYESWEAFAQRKGFEAEASVPGDADVAITYKSDVLPRGMYSVRSTQ